MTLQSSEVESQFIKINILRANQIAGYPCLYEGRVSTVCAKKERKKEKKP